VRIPNVQRVQERFDSQGHMHGKRSVGKHALKKTLTFGLSESFSVNDFWYVYVCVHAGRQLHVLQGCVQQVRAQLK
jgi:hypothetical protein